MSTYDWVSIVRDYEAEAEKRRLPLQEAETNPLEKKYEDEPVVKKPTSSSSDPLTSGKAKPKPKKVLDDDEEIIDPLSVLAKDADMDDPLSAKDPLSLAVATATVAVEKKALSVMDDSFEPWALKRPAILAKFTTSEKLSIISSFFGSTAGAKVVNVSNTMSDKVKNRLEQLDDFEEGSLQEMMDLSLQDYITRIDQLNQELRDAWAQEQRVKALKIVIQCAKLLADTNVIRFYPSKFVLITDILDTFGELVFERIRVKSAYFPSGSTVPRQLPEDFTPDMVPNSAKETCRNWFYKIASIRELLPRLYVECAILRCYSFLKVGEYEDALKRLTAMMRGIGDPLVSLYARTYLCRVGVLVAPHVRTHLMDNFNDFMATYEQLSSNIVQNQLALQRVEFPQYLNLFTPGLDWILQCIAYKAPEATLVNILGVCEKTTNSSLLLNSIMSAFPPAYISARASHFTTLIKEASETGLPKHHLFRTLGMNVTLSAPPKEALLTILNEVWKVVTKIKDAAEYIACADVWIEYPVKNFGPRETNAMLGDIIKHMQVDRAFESHYQQLQSILGKILAHMHNFADIFSMDKFMPFIDLFQKDTVKLDVCKGVMEAFVRNQAEATSDPVILNAMMFIGKTLHDSMSAMSFDDERRQIAALIVGFLSKMSFGRDFEQTLNFLVEARATFSNLDYVMQYLVHSVNLLITKTREIVGGQHTRKTAAFVRSCIACNFITIPSIAGYFERLQLYLVSGWVALVNQALTQAEEFFKAAIALIAEVPPEMEMDLQKKSTEPMLLEYIYELLSTLLVVPDNPQFGVLSIVKALVNVVAEYNWGVDSDAPALIYTRSLSLLAASSQPKFLYGIEGVDTNDHLYAAGPKYVAAVNEIVDSMIEQVLGHLKELTGGDAANRRKATVALDLMERVLVLADLSKPKTAGLCVNLWKLGTSARVDAKADARIKSTLRRLAALRRPGAADLIGKL